MSALIKNDGILDEGHLVPWSDIKDLRLLHYRGRLEKVLARIHDRTLTVEPKDVSVDLAQVAQMAHGPRVRRVYVETTWPNYLLLVAV
ncbi:MAG TPA: hypothetical protein VHS06_03845 [Chloroflexota bacterium]|nr:hypothetical protein [Chloroflexota bacterium]